MYVFHVDEKVAIKAKKEQKAAKSATKKKEVAAETKSEVVKEKSVVATAKSPAPSKPAPIATPKAGTQANSTGLNARMAIAQLAHITSLADLEKYLAGETRATVLRRGNSRRNALNAS